MGRKRTPFVSAPQSEAEREFYWLKPELVAEVSFLEWTLGGQLRHPVVSRSVRRQAGTDYDARKHGRVQSSPEPPQCRPNPRGCGTGEGGIGADTKNWYIMLP
ncbi:hypothetical protein [Burkholderia ambifaria]|uniref:ATP dependent DNA ligase n=1 Tax=Burkholderia ambifaria TaxID=152480 RepID=UPI000A7CEB17|nr:hypothetical protein [Burkholderia ambifaria]